MQCVCVGEEDYVSNFSTTPIQADEDKDLWLIFTQKHNIYLLKYLCEWV